MDGQPLSRGVLTVTPTARTLTHLRRLGFIADVCERWLPHVNRRRDLFGLGDVIAFPPRDKLVLIVQATSLAPVGDRKRRSIRLGKVSRRQAEAVKLRVEALNAAAISKCPLDGETAAWIAEIGGELAKKLARAGLIAPRASGFLPCVAEFAKVFLESKPHIKPTTRRTFQVALDRMTAAIGPDKWLSDIAEETMLTAITKLKADGYAPAFVGKLV